VFEITYDVVVFVTGLTAVLAALGVILCSSPIYCALYLIGHMICLALLFLLYNAEFVAAVQIIVYAGAVMILFLLTFERFMALSFAGTLFGELLLAATVGPTQPIRGAADAQVIAEVGSAKVVGLELFSRPLVPFELASALLLVAAVGIICLAKFPGTAIKRRVR